MKSSKRKKTACGIAQAHKNEVITGHLDDLLIAELSGGRVTEQAAMKQATVYACVSLIADNVAQLPLHLYEHGPNGRTRAVRHPLYRILRGRPNSWQTSFEFWQYMTLSLLLRGIACAQIARGVGGEVVSLIPLAPHAYQEVWDGADHYYDVTLVDGTHARLQPDEVFCIKAMSLDGRYAVSPIEYAAANTVGLSLDAIKYARAFYKNGARPGGVLTTPAMLTTPKAKEMQQEWEETYSGSNNGRVAVLYGGLTYQPITMSNSDAQLLELMGYNDKKICGLYRVPPFLVGVDDGGTAWGTGMSEQKQSFITFTINPWCERIVAAIYRDLLRGSEKAHYYAEFLTEQFLKGSPKEASDAYKLALGGTQNPGYMTINEVRRRENLPELPDCDEIYKPVSQNGAAVEETDKNEK